MFLRLVTISAATAAVVCGSAALAQELVAAVPLFEIIGTRQVTEAKSGGVFPGGADEWRPADPLNTRGLVVSIRATFPADVTTELEPWAVTLSYTTGGAWQKAACLGVTLGGALERGGKWHLRGFQGIVLHHLSSAGRTIEASFLFEVPPDVSEVSLIYRGKAILKAVPLPWK